MKKILFLFSLIFLVNNASAQTNIVYLDVQFIIDNSLLGKHYKNIIKKYENEKKPELKSKEEIIKNKENEINNQKNILKKEELEIKISELQNIINQYQSERNKINKSIIEMKKDYSKNILKVLNPLLTKYVEKNNIILVVEKKNILIGVKSLDITQNILEVFDTYTTEKNLIDEN